ncbi:MAG: flavorubredoxin [Lentimonas sp.]
MQADGVNVGYDIYRIARRRTSAQCRRIEQGQSAYGFTRFSSTHLEWLHMIKDHIASSAVIVIGLPTPAKPYSSAIPLQTILNVN